MSGDTLHSVGNYAIAIVGLVLLAKWLRVQPWGVGITALVALFLPGIPILVIIGVIAWRLIKRQPLRGPSPEQLEHQRREQDEDLDRLAGV